MNLCTCSFKRTEQDVLCRLVPHNSPRFTTAMLTDDGAHFQVLNGNADSGGLTAERDFSSPAHKEGTIVLWPGVDNSNWAKGTFYEGIMNSGTLSRAAERHPGEYRGSPLPVVALVENANRSEDRVTSIIQPP